MPPSLGWRWWHLLRARVGDELSEAHRIVAHGEFEHAVEDEPSTPRSPAIEPEGELVEVALEMRLVEAPLVGPGHPALGERGDPRCLDIEPVARTFAL